MSKEYDQDRETPFPSKPSEDPRTHSGLQAATLRASASLAHSVLPDTNGFILIVAKFGDGKTDEQADYISNVKREDAIAALKTILFRWGVNDEWMKKL